MNYNIFEKAYSFTSFIDLKPDEVEKVWGWRNHESIRKWMYHTEIIPIENHLKFIEKLSDAKDKIYFLVKRENVPLGVFSIIDINNDQGEWGYYIAPEYHNQNFGVEFYYYALKYVFESLNFKKIIGFALLENKPANSLNDLFGFTKIIVNKNENGKTHEYYYRELNLETWKNKVKGDKKIMRLLELTVNKKLI